MKAPSVDQIARQNDNFSNLDFIIIPKSFDDLQGTNGQFVTTELSIV
jgi:hypothetical protein